MLSILKEEVIYMSAVPSTFETSVYSASDNTRTEIADLGNWVGILETKKEATEDKLLDNLTARMKERISDDDGSPSNEYLLDRIVIESKMLALGNIFGTLHNQDAVNTFFSSVLCTQDPSSSIGMSSLSLGPLKESDQKKFATISFSSEEVETLKLHVRAFQVITHN